MTVVGSRRTAPLPSFDHLLHLSDHLGTFEHADHTVVRRRHGYCTDDVARVLVVVAREPEPTLAVQRLGRVALRFLGEAKGISGKVRNRRGADGRWHGRRGVEDCWGRAVWAFGTAANLGTNPWLSQVGEAAFERAAQQRSPWRHASAFAALGAAEVLAADPSNGRARSMLVDAVEVIGPLGSDPGWPWPVERLSYANAAIAEALIAAGHHLGRGEVVDQGTTMLAWLLDRETVDGHLSPTGVGGSGPGDVGPAFDQQAIEVAAMADACARAAIVTGDGSWEAGVDLAVGWFLGDNDAGCPMWDPATGGGYDGLEPDGPNLNQGAESTIALISTLQHARRRALMTSPVPA